MSDKTSRNQTGTLFYTRYSSDNSKYRIRFKSFNMAMFEDTSRIALMEDMQNNYNMFKYVCIIKC